jgi:hypothetical protein
VISKTVRFQVVVTDKHDFIIQYRIFNPTTVIEFEEMMNYIELSTDVGDIKVTRWNKLTGERV